MSQVPFHIGTINVASLFLVEMKTKTRKAHCLLTHISCLYGDLDMFKVGTLRRYHSFSIREPDIVLGVLLPQMRGREIAVKDNGTRVRFPGIT